MFEFKKYKVFLFNLLFSRFLTFQNKINFALFILIVYNNVNRKI